MGDPSNIGMMEGAFFVSRGELISWVKELLDVNITKVEQCATGCIYAQIVDAVHPGKVHMSKLKWEARAEYEFIQNFKILQQALERVGVTRNVEVAKLVKGKYQDNLEMLQWMRAYADRMGCAEDYDPVRRRGVLPASAPDWFKTRNTKENVQPSKSRQAPERRVGSAKLPAKLPAKAAPTRPYAPPVRGKEDAGSPSGEATALRSELAQLRVTAQGLERERDFYFGKLRDIEIECQNHEAAGDSSTLTLDGVMETVQTILYATDDEDQ